MRRISRQNIVSKLSLCIRDIVVNYDYSVIDSLCVNVLLQIDDGKHVLVEQILVLHLFCHLSEKVGNDLDLIYLRICICIQNSPIQPLLFFQGLVKVEFTWRNGVFKLNHLRWASGQSPGCTISFPTGKGSS